MQAVMNFFRVAQVALIVTPLLLDAETLEGRIAAIGDKAIVVAMPMEQRAIKVSSTTTITLDGKPAKLDELPTGGPVVLTVEGKGKDAFAKTIVAMSVK
jgi:hypothetical protein